VNELEDYYRELILDHSRRPRNRGVLEDWTHQGESVHTNKGDRMKIFVRVTQHDAVEAVTFEGEGSAIALASASLLTRYLTGKSLEACLQFSAKVKDMLLSPTQDEQDLSALEDVAALAGIRQFPARIACALLAWEAFENAVEKDVYRHS